MAELSMLFNPHSTKEVFLLSTNLVFIKTESVSQKKLTAKKCRRKKCYLPQTYNFNLILLSSVKLYPAIPFCFISVCQCNFFYPSTVRTILFDANLFSEQLSLSSYKEKK